MIYKFNVTPMPAPTIVASDRYKHRPIVMRYYSYRDHIRLLANTKGLRTLPGCIESLIFNIPMPSSWTRSKKDRLRFTPHESRPDIDNILRGFMNVFGEDSHIHSVRNMQKIWSDFGSIELKIEDVTSTTMADDEIKTEYGSDVYRNL